MTDKLWSFHVAQFHLPPDFTREDCRRWLRKLEMTDEEISDEVLAQTAARAKDEQEALSVRYSSATLLVTPLSSGRFAIFDKAHQLIDIVDELDVDELRRWSKERNDELRQRAMMASMMGEPSDKQLARDMTVVRSAHRRPKRTTRQSLESLAVDIEL